MHDTLVGSSRGARSPVYCCDEPSNAVGHKRGRHAAENPPGRPLKSEVASPRIASVMLDSPMLPAIAGPPASSTKGSTGAAAASLLAPCGWRSLITSGSRPRNDGDVIWSCAFRHPAAIGAGVARERRRSAAPPVKVWRSFGRLALISIKASSGYLQRPAGADGARGTIALLECAAEICLCDMRRLVLIRVKSLSNSLGENMLEMRRGAWLHATYRAL